MEKLNREQALALLKKYNKEAFHLRHALTVGIDVGAAGDADHRRLLGHVLAEAAAQTRDDHVFDERVAVVLGVGGQLHHAAER